MKKRLLSIVWCTVMILSSFVYIPVFAEETTAVRYTDTDPYWISPADKAPLEDYAYSIAVVGDTQIVSHYQPEHLETLVGWLLDNKDEKNIQFVSFLGDISDSWDEDDKNNNGIWDSYEELEASRTAFYKLNGVIPYSIARGNHDSTAEFNKYFANNEYMSQFEGFYDIGCAKNSYRRIMVGEQKFLFITLDCGVHDGALDWAGELCEQYSDHKVIVSTHSYLHSTRVPSDKSMHSAVTTKTDGTANNGDGIWEKFVRKYENIFIVLSGHFSSADVVCSQVVGDNGNVVNQFLIDPQGLDKGFYDNGSDVTGMVTMLYFSEDGKTMQVEQYSTVYDKFYSASSQLKVDLENAFIAKDEFFYNYDFDGVPVGTQQEYIYSNIFSATSSLSNPYGFTLDTDAKLNGTVVKHTDGSGNYLRINYSGTNTDQLTGARFRLVDKNGHSYTVAQSVSFEFDLRWQGVSDASLIGDEQVMDLLQFRRAGQTLNLLKATVVADGDVADQKLRIYTPEGNDVVTLDKDDDSFTKFKVVYYDVTQTYSVWVGNQIVVEARAATGTNIRRYEYVTTLYDADFMAVSREEVSTSDGINFIFGAVSYSDTLHTPFVIDIDNVCIKKYENGDGRAVYYENSFDGANSPFAIGDNTKGNSYNTIGKYTIESDKNAGDKYLKLDPSSGTGYFSIIDQLNLLQDGDWTIEFDIRATYSNGDSDTKYNPSSAESLIRFGDSGYNNHYPLHVNEAASIRYGFGNGQARAVPNVTMASAESDAWTHIAVSVSVNEANKNKTDDWLAQTGSSSLTYSMSVWVDGVYAGSVNTGNRKEINSFSSNAARFINNRKWTRAAVTAEPNLTGYTLLEEASSDTVKIYRSSDGKVMYRLSYDDTGALIAGTVGGTTATGSIKLTEGGYDGTMDYLQLFSNKTTVSGAMDNVIIYKGIIPTSGEKQRADATVNDSVVRSIDFTEIGLYDSINDYKAGGKDGVVYLNTWTTSTVKRDKTNDLVTVTGAGTQTVLDVFTPDIAGKTFSIKLKAKNFVWADESTETSGKLLTLRIQNDPSATAVFAPVLSYDENGLYFTKGAGKYYLCDQSGNNISLGTDWKNLEVIVDETRLNTAVSFRVNGETMYFKAPGFSYEGYYFKAVNIEGIIDTVKGLAGAADQRVRILDMSADAKYSVDLMSFEVKLIDNPYPIWADDVMIDFSDYTSLEELGGQFYYTDGVSLENGELIIPEGETFAWLDYNDSLYNFSGGYTSGYNIEIKAKGDTTESYVISVDQGSLGKIGLVTPAAAALNSLDSDRYSDLSTTFAASRNGATVFNDATYRGFYNFSNTSALGAKDFMAIRFASGLKIAELYIHDDLGRELYKESGDIINLDADSCQNVTYVNGIIGNQNNAFTKETYVAPTGDETEGYYRWDCTSTAFGDRRADLSLTDYIFNEVTVFEYDFALTYPAGATGSNMEFLSFRRMWGYQGTGATAQWEKLLYITDNGKLNTNIHGMLYNEDGTVLQLADGARSKVAVIYDGVHKKISYRVNGQIPYIKSGENYVLADKLSLTTTSYAKRSYDTRLVTLNLGDNFKGIFDLYNFNIYNVESDMTTDLVGVQVDVSDSNIRLVGGVDMLYYGSVGYELEVQDANGNLLSTAERSFNNNVVYSSIKADSDTLYPDDFGWRYFFTANIENVDTTKPVKLLIKPYTAVNDVKSYGEKLALNIDFTSGNMGNWTYEFEEFDRNSSSADISSLTVCGNKVGIVEGKTDYYCATNGKETVEIEVKTLSPNAAITISDISDGSSVKVVSADGKTEKVYNIHMIETAALYRYNLNTWLIPYWQGNIVYHESALMVGSRGAKLLYTPEHILSVRSCDLKTEYVEGVDYEIRDGVIYRINGGRLPYYTEAEFYPASADKSITGVSAELNNGGYIISSNSATGTATDQQEKCIFVTYTHDRDVNYYTPSVTTKLSKVIEKLERGETVNLVVYGDSISAGSNSTGNHNVAPYTPKWGEMVAEALRAQYPNATVNYTNTAFGGKDVKWGSENYGERVNAHEPDLLIYGFGMNNPNMSAETYIGYVKTTIDGVLAENPDCEILTIGSMIFNPDVKGGGENDTRNTFEAALVEFVKDYENIDVVPMTSVHKSLLQNKNFYDMSSNNTNHPNDFLIRIYAQSILKTLIG